MDKMHLRLKHNTTILVNDGNWSLREGDMFYKLNLLIDEEQNNNLYTNLDNLYLVKMD